MKHDYIRFCVKCGGLLPAFKNGNTKYCRDECYKENKSIETGLANKKKAQQVILLKNDDIIDKLFTVYQSNYYITAKQLIDSGFNWDIHSDEIMINGIVAKKLIRYAYTLFTNQTVQLWKL